MCEKAKFIESSRGKRLLIRDDYKYFLAYELKSGLSYKYYKINSKVFTKSTSKFDYIGTYILITFNYSILACVRTPVKHIL